MLADAYRRTLANWMWALGLLSVLALAIALVYDMERGGLLAFRITAYTVLFVLPLVAVLIMVHYLTVGALVGKSEAPPRRRR